MSNTIWKKPDQKPDNDNDIICLVGALPFAGYYEKFNASYVEHTTGENYTPDEIDRWCYVDDLIAQADKAELLQKALCFIRNIRGAGMSYQDMFLDAHEVAKTALDPKYKPVLCGRYDEEMLDLIKQLTGAAK